MGVVNTTRACIYLCVCVCGSSGKCLSFSHELEKFFKMETKYTLPLCSGTCKIGRVMLSAFFRKHTHTQTLTTAAASHLGVHILRF